MGEREEEVRMSDLVLIFALTYSYRMAIPEYLGHFALLGVRSKDVCVHRSPSGLVCGIYSTH